jgi:hypothetical protein
LLALQDKTGCREVSTFSTALTLNTEMSHVEG